MTPRNIKVSWRILADLKGKRISRPLVIAIACGATALLAGFVSVRLLPRREKAPAPSSIPAMPTRAVQINPETKAIELVPIEDL